MTATEPTGFLAPPTVSDAVRVELADDVAARGFAMNLTRAWAHVPGLRLRLMDVGNEAADAAGLGERDRAVVIAAIAASIGDRYCGLVWGEKLAVLAGEDVARSVLAGADDGLAVRDLVLARWARTVAVDPASGTAADVAELRNLGLTDDQVLGLTAFAAVRGAFASVNDALGVPPDDAVEAAARPLVHACVDRSARRASVRCEPGGRGDPGGVGC